MAATGKTPILLYGSTTTTNVPVAGNLTNSSDGCEIAINVADKNLFFKDATNAVNTVPIRQSSGSSDGWLSSANWTTFNSKQAAYTNLTTIGSLANATGWLYNNGSGTFSYSTPSASDVGAVPTSRTVSTTSPLAGGGALSSNLTLSITQATTSTSGYLSSTDWNTFNNKQPAGTYVTSVTGTAPVVSSGGTTPAISMAAATGSVNGYLTSTDWTTFNSKQAALVSGSNIKTVSGVSLLGSGDVGTIGTGYGGTGLTSFTANGIVYASSTSALATSSSLVWNGTNLLAGTSTVINYGGNASGERFQAVTTTANTNIVFPVAAFINRSSGTAAAGIGAQVDLCADNAYSSVSPYGSIACVARNLIDITGDLIFNTMLNNASTEKMRIFSTGGVSIGNTTDPGAKSAFISGTLSVGSATSPYYDCYIKGQSGSGAMLVYCNASSTYASLYVPGSGSVNGVASGANGNGLVIIQKDSGNLRSISAAGSINANGTDYAEYMTKNSDFVLNKGDICGIDSNGNLTNKYSESNSFIIKSTNPSYVGGDAWFTEIAPEDESLLAGWKERMEMARSTVDRMAFCGQVPVNVENASVGQYIVPVTNEDDSIGGIAVNEQDLTMQQYIKSVGKVISVDASGRPTVIVKVS